MVQQLKTYDDYYKATTRGFEYVYKKLNDLYDDYECFFSKSDEGAISNFINNYLLDKYYGKSDLSFVANFLESSFEYWLAERNDTFKYSKYGYRSIKISWIIGKTAILRYEKIKDMDLDWDDSDRTIRKKFDINLVKAFGLDCLIDPEDWEGVIEIEEVQKARFYDTDKGYIFCIRHTTLYNNMSKYCIKCMNKRRCKKMLKRTYNNLYKLRGYDETTDL